MVGCSELLGESAVAASLFYTYGDNYSTIKLCNNLTTNN